MPGSSRGSQAGPAPTSRRVLHHLRQVGALSKDRVVVILIRKKDEQQVKILWEAQQEDRLKAMFWSGKVLQGRKTGKWGGRKVQEER